MYHGVLNISKPTDCISYPAGVIGRPREELNLDMVELCVHFKVSRSMIYRRMKEEGVFFEVYTQIKDSDLDRAIIVIKSRHPHDGEVLMAGHLHCQGLYITRARLRSSLQRFDARGIEAVGEL